MSIPNSIIKGAWLCLLCITLVRASPLPGTKLVGRALKVSQTGEPLQNAVHGVVVGPGSKEENLNPGKIIQEEKSIDPNKRVDTKPSSTPQDKPEQKKTIPLRLSKNVRKFINSFREKFKKNPEPKVVVQKEEEKVKPEVLTPQVTILPENMGRVKKWYFTSKSLVPRILRWLKRYFTWKKKPKIKTDSKKKTAEELKIVEENKNSEKVEGKAKVEESVKQSKTAGNNKVNPISDDNNETKK